MSKDAYKKGMKTRRKVLGDEWVDRAMRAITPFNADFQELITRYAWDDIWNRDGMSHAERRRIVIAMLVAGARWEEFQLHVGAALRSGDLGEDDIREILMTAAIYCGVPAANTAFREARAVIESLGSAKAKKKKKSL